MPFKARGSGNIAYTSLFARKAAATSERSIKHTTTKANKQKKRKKTTLKSGGLVNSLATFIHQRTLIIPDRVEYCTSAMCGNSVHRPTACREGRWCCTAHAPPHMAGIVLMCFVNAPNRIMSAMFH